LISWADEIVNELQKITEPEFKKQVKEELIMKYKEGKAWDRPFGKLKKAKKSLEAI
jgi:hypothetical protein